VCDRIGFVEEMKLYAYGDTINAIKGLDQRHAPLNCSVDMDLTHKDARPEDAFAGLEHLMPLIRVLCLAGSESKLEVMEASMTNELYIDLSIEQK